MSATPEPSKPFHAMALLKTFLWRILLTLFILWMLAGPGASLLQAMVQTP